MLIAYGFGTVKCNTISSKRDPRVPISQCLRYFAAIVSSAACFAGRRRTIYQEHIQTLDLHFRKFWRSIVGGLPYIDWTFFGHSNVLKSYTLGTNEQHILFAPRKLRVGPGLVLVRIRNWRLTLPIVPFNIGYQKKNDTRVQGNIFVTQNPFVRIDGF